VDYPENVDVFVNARIRKDCDTDKLSHPGIGTKDSEDDIQNSDRIELQREGQVYY